MIAHMSNDYQNQCSNAGDNPRKWTNIQLQNGGSRSLFSIFLKNRPHTYPSVSYIMKKRVMHMS